MRPRFALASALALAVMTGCASEPRAAHPTPPREARAHAGPTIEQFMKIRAAGSAVSMPSGELLTRDWPDGIYQIYRADSGVSRPAQPGVKLTSFPDGVGSYSLAPDGSKILALAASGGNENFQVYLVDPRARDDRSVTPVLSDPKVQHAVNAWLHDGSGFIYTANDASPSDFYIYRYDLATKAKTLLLDKPGSWEAADITDDGSRLLVTQYRSISDASIFELDAATRELTDVTPKSDASPTVSAAMVGYLPGENAFLYVSDAVGGLNRLYRRSVSSGDVTRPIPAIDAYEIDGAWMSPSRNLLAIVTNQDGYGELSLYRLPGFQPVPLPPIEKGVVSVSDLGDRHIVWTLDNARTPNLAFRLDLANAAATPAQVTVADDQGIDLGSFPLPELVKYTSFDGREIPAFVFLPPGTTRGEPIPFIANFHGGPEGQHRPGFDRTSQFLLARGYGVIKPNVRGSTGYGREFHMLDDYKNRWDSVRDGVEAARWLVKNRYAEPGRIAAYGGSYGGFMAVATIVEDAESDRPVFGASVDVVGVVNMKTFLERTSGYRQKLREAEYGPLTDPEFLESISPIHKVESIRVPMMIAHGYNDPRVPVFEAMQLGIELQKLGRDPVQLYFPDEGHGFAKLENRLLFARTMADFLDRTVGAK